jgi:hypothetical protein
VDLTGSFLRTSAAFILSLPNIGQKSLEVTWLQAAPHLFYLL